MAQARTRSAERQAESFDRLAEVLERVVTAQQPVVPARDRFKAPEYDGSGDVDYFIQQFADVAEANGWTAGASLLHLRAALKAAAQDCGKAGTIPEITAALRARFGLTTREARAKIISLKRGHKTSLQEHATEVERLVNIAYADLPDQHRVGMIRDTFQSTVGDAALQRHLLAVGANTLTDAVRAGNEFLQVQSTSAGSAIRQVDQGGALPDEEVHVKPVTDTTLGSLFQAIKKLTEEIEKSRNKEGPAKQTRDPKSGKCFGCGKSGHIRKDCSSNPWPKTDKKPATQGNDQSPQQ